MQRNIDERFKIVNNKFEQQNKEITQLLSKVEQNHKDLTKSLKATNDTVNRKVGDFQDDLKEVELSQQDIEKRMNQELNLA